MSSDIEAKLMAAYELHKAGQLESAETSYRSLLTESPAHIGLAYLLGSLLLQKDGHVEEGLGLLNWVVENYPEHVPARANIGLCYYVRRQYTEAYGWFDSALAYDASDVSLLYKCALSAIKIKLFDKAINCFDVIYSLSPKKFVEYAPALIQSLWACGRTLQALEYCERWERIAPGDIECSALRCISLGRSGIFECVDESVLEQLDSKPTAKSLFLRAIVAYPFSRVRAAELYREALELDPTNGLAHFNYSICLLSTGQLEAGWHEFDWRFHPDAPVGPHGRAEPEWDGRPLNGAGILVHSEQGLGDVIQFMRYAPMIKALGGRVIFASYGEVLDLLRLQDGAEISSDAEGIDLSYEWQIPLLSLAKVLSPTESEIPANIPYLFAPRARSQYWAEHLDSMGAQFRVGLVWAGNPLHGNDHNRSAALEDFSALSAVPNVTFLSIQKGPSERQVECLPFGFHVHSLSDSIQNFADTAAIIENLDLVICVDTSVAHLAGAMGKRVWMLLPAHCDWRWIEGRETTPWYPTMRLFRLEMGQSWAQLMPRLADELYALVADVVSYPPLVSNLYSTMASASTESVLAAMRQVNRDASSWGELEWVVVRASQCQRTDVLTLLQEEPDLPVLIKAILVEKDGGNALELWQQAFETSREAGHLANLLRCLLNRHLLREAESYLDHDGNEPIDVLYQRAQLYRMNGSYLEAITLYRQVLTVCPRWVAAWCNLGLALHSAGNDAEAYQAFQSALMLKPKIERAWFFIGWFLFRTRRYREALLILSVGLARFPQSLDIKEFRAHALYQLGNDADAAKIYRELLAERNGQELSYMLLIAEQYIRPVEETDNGFKRLLAMYPDWSKLHIAYGMHLARSGRWRQSFAHYEYRLIGSKDQFVERYPGCDALVPWRGQSLGSSTLIINVEQGFGDTIQYVRYLKFLTQGKVVLLIPSALMGIVKRNYPHVELRDRDVVDSGEIMRLAGAYIDLMSLPMFLPEAELGSFRQGYLQVDSARSLGLMPSAELSGRRKIGLVWAGSPGHENNHLRSYSLIDLNPLFEIENVAWFNFQLGHERNQLELFPESAVVVDLSGHLNNFEASAALLLEMDVFVTVDTAMAHLAGALGVNTILILGLHPDWRWGMTGDQCLPYESIHVLREAEFSSRAALIAKLRDLIK